MNDHTQLFLALLSGTMFGGLTYIFIPSVFIAFFGASLGMCLLMACVSYVFPNEDGHLWDERTEMISHKALALSWFTVIAALPVLFWIDFLSLVEMSSWQHLFAVWVIAVVSASGFYFFKK